MPSWVYRPSPPEVTQPRPAMLLPAGGGTVVPPFRGRPFGLPLGWAENARLDVAFYQPKIYSPVPAPAQVFNVPIAGWSGKREWTFDTYQQALPEPAALLPLGGGTVVPVLTGPVLPKGWTTDPPSWTFAHYQQAQFLLDGAALLPVGGGTVPLGLSQRWTAAAGYDFAPYLPDTFTVPVAPTAVFATSLVGWSAKREWTFDAYQQALPEPAALLPLGGGTLMPVLRGPVGIPPGWIEKTKVDLTFYEATAHQPIDAPAFVFASPRLGMAWPDRVAIDYRQLSRTATLPTGIEFLHPASAIAGWSGNPSWSFVPYQSALARSLAALSSSPIVALIKFLYLTATFGQDAMAAETFGQNDTNTTTFAKTTNREAPE